jgi:YbgC/YbaW family acyl-CoA thioester hydrolase
VTVNTRPHQTAIRVRFGELDPYNHVNHAVYVQYFEAARVELLAEAGIFLGRMRSDVGSIVVSEIQTRFLASAEELDNLIVETEVVEMRRVTSLWRQRILRGDQVIATQDVRAAMVDPSGKPIRFPEEMVASLRPYMAAEDDTASG